MFIKKFLIVGVALLLIPSVAWTQDILPEDNGLATYHTTPRYRESESHPLRIVGYVLHPIGWLAREGIFRPLSYFFSSTETTRSVFGYREPFDYRQPECFSADDSIPDCRSVSPFNYDQLAPAEEEVVALMEQPVRQVYFPDVNFDFDVRTLNDLGKGRSRQIAQLLDKEAGLHVVLEGHADYIGTVEYNETLGMDRSDAVRQELMALGVPVDRLSTVTFGKSQPIFEEKEDWARAVNRRVEIHIDEAGEGLGAAAAEGAPADEG